MSKELKNIKGVVMDQIHNGKIKMRPRLYFILGSIFAVCGLVASIIISMFFISLTIFALRTHGPMGEYRLEQLISSFPWWAPLIAIIGLIIGIWLLRQYDFSYKTKPFILALGFVAAILIAVWFMDITNLDEKWLRFGPKQGWSGPCLQKNNIL